MKVVLGFLTVMVSLSALAVEGNGQTGSAFEPVHISKRQALATCEVGIAGYASEQAQIRSFLTSKGIQVISEYKASKVRIRTGLALTVEMNSQNDLAPVSGQWLWHNRHATSLSDALSASLPAIISACQTADPVRSFDVEHLEIYDFGDTALRETLAKASQYCLNAGFQIVKDSYAVKGSAEYKDGENRITYTCVR